MGDEWNFIRTCDDPSFESDKPFEHLGETFALPPYFEDQRNSIEAKIKPLPTQENE